ncbi:MAG: PAS domain S-box protein, partial [Cytophagales bacterium]|nr:PAS domain S-box protein [Cytophagales bacterium]
LGYSQNDFLAHYSTYLTDNPINEEVVKHTDLSLQGKQQPSYEVEHYHKDGSILRIEVTEVPVFDKEGNLVAIEGIAHDITDRVRAQKELEHRFEFEQLITTISTQFINPRMDEIDNAITNALKSIGVFAGVDRSYIFRLSDSGDKIDNTHEWCSEGTAPQIQYLKGINLNAELPWMAKRLANLEVVHITNVADLPHAARLEKKHFAMQDIKSLIVVPMVSGGSLMGFLGFDSVRSKTVWPEDVVMMLKIVGEIFTN